VYCVLSKRMLQAQVTTLLNTKTYREKWVGLSKVFWYSPAFEHCQHKICSVTVQIMLLTRTVNCGFNRYLVISSRSTTWMISKMLPLSINARVSCFVHTLPLQSTVNATV
jgi:hypothetical protein